MCTHTSAHKQTIAFKELFFRNQNIPKYLKFKSLNTIADQIMKFVSVDFFLSLILLSSHFAPFAIFVRNSIHFFVHRSMCTPANSIIHYVCANGAFFFIDLKIHFFILFCLCVCVYFKTIRFSCSFIGVTGNISFDQHR